MNQAFEELESAVFTAVSTYSNVNRGYGHFSLVSSRILELARDSVLEYLELNKEQYCVIFLTPLRADALMTQLESSSFHSLSSQDIGLPLGLRILAVKKSGLPKGIPFQTGGGVVKLVSPDSVVFTKGPERFEAGTPSIINIIVLIKSLHLSKKYGHDLFLDEIQSTDTDYAQSAQSIAAILYKDDLENISGSDLLQALRESAPGKNIEVPTSEGLLEYTNFDNAASTPTFLPVWNTVCQIWKKAPASSTTDDPSCQRDLCGFFRFFTR